MKKFSIKQLIAFACLFISLFSFLFCIKNFISSHSAILFFTFLLLFLYLFFFPLCLPKFTKCSKISFFAIHFHTKKDFFCIFLLLFSLTILRGYWIFQKTSLHIDETATISLSNKNEFSPWQKDYEKMYEYSGKYLKETFLFDSSNIQDSFRDVYNLHKDNWDTPWTNLYYSAFRLWFTGIKTSDVNFIIKWGCCLNIVFFVISFFLMYSLILKFTNSLSRILLCLFVAFCNPITISTTLFLRPYELQSLLLILFSNIYASYIVMLERKIEFSNFHNFFITSALISLVMLSAYFSMIYICILGFILFVSLVHYKQEKQNSWFIGVFITSLLLSKIIFFKFGAGLFDYRGEEVASKLSITNFFINAKITFESIKKIHHLDNILSISFFIFVLLFFICQFNIKKLKKTFFNWWCIIIAIFIWYSCVLFLAPYKIARYVSPVIPLMGLLFANDFGELNRIKINVCRGSIFFVICTLFLSSINIGFSKNQFIEHLDEAHRADMEFSSQKDFPVVILSDLRWKYGDLIPYLNDAQSVYFVDSLSDIKKLGLCSFYLLDSFYVSDYPADFLISNQHRLCFYNEQYIELKSAGIDSVFEGAEDYD